MKDPDGSSIVYACIATVVAKCARQAASASTTAPSGQNACLKNRDVFVRLRRFDAQNEGADIAQRLIVLQSKPLFADRFSVMKGPLFLPRRS
ncbi:hypothetical protein [Rhizobium tropici]|nr:hypothetical protein [Rhizobium tropici]